jgi:cytochrome c556
MNEIHRVIAASAVAISTLVGVNPYLHAHEIVPGPFGNIVDHQKPLEFKDGAGVTRHTRQQAMRAFSAHFRFIEGVSTYNAPFAPLVPVHAGTLAELGSILPQLFEARAPMEPGKFGARPAIWDNPDVFAQHMTGFQEATRKLVQAIGDRRPLAEPVLAVRHQCLACHQVFREFAPRN